MWICNTSNKFGMANLPPTPKRWSLIIWLIDEKSGKLRLKG